jgi:uncharacterized protein YkwD
MKTRRSLEIAIAAAVALEALCFLFLSAPARSQEHSANPNRPPHPAAALSSHPTVDEKFLLDAANRERAAAGLQALKWDSALAEAARQHAKVMVSQDLLLHQCLDEAPLNERAAKAGAKFSMIAENIAVGPNLETIHDGWMHSPGHRKNILSADVTAVGIATLRGSGGLFAVQDFSRSVEGLSLQQQEERVVSLLKGNGIHVADVTEEARSNCDKKQAIAAAPGSYVIRFEATQLETLPDNLLERVKSRAYRKAGVGACRSGNTSGFTLYRLAVVLN